MKINTRKMPIEQAMDIRIESYINYIVKIITGEIHKKLIDTKTYLYEFEVFDYVYNYMKTKRFKIQYTDFLISRISIEVKSKCKKYIKQSVSLEDLFD